MRRRSLLPVLLVLLVGLVYSNTLHNELQLDDAYRIADNPEVERVFPVLRHFTDPRTSATIPQLGGYRPLLPLSLSINNALSEALGLDRLAGYHLGNILIHVATCLLVFLLARELLLLAAWSDFLRARSAALAFGAALLFGVHPISGIPVNYVSARDLLLATLLLTAALLAYVRMRRPAARRPPNIARSMIGWGLALGCLGLSLAAKQNGVFFPALILFFEVIVMRSSIRSREPWLRASVFAMPVAGFFIGTERILGFSDLAQVTSTTTAPVIYFLTQMKLHLFHYLRNFVWPFQMRPQPLIEPAAGFADAGALAGLAFVAGSLLFAWWLRRRAPVASWAIVSYWVLFAPTSSLRPFYDLAVDYRQYPSLPFLCLLVVLGLGWVLGRLDPLPAWPARAAVATLALFTLYIATASFSMNRIWRTDKSLWEQSVRYGASALGHLNYGHAIQVEDPKLAEYHYHEALRLAPGFVYAHINLGMLQMGQGRTAEGLGTLRKAVESAPEWAISHHWMAKAYRQVGHAALALEESRRAADLDPRNVEYQYQTAYDLYETGELADSLLYLERIAELTPGYKQSRFLQGFALQQLGRWQEGEPLYRRYLEEHPDDAQAWFNLGHGLANAGDCEAALPMFEECLRLAPGHGAAAYWLAQCRVPGLQDAR